MSELSHIKMFVFLILMLQFAVTEQLSSIAVRAGDDVTLTCGRVKDEQDECQNIEWFYDNSDHTRTDELVKNGQIKASGSNRLRLGAKCSLVMKIVTNHDVGRYICRQRGEDSQVYLSVVTLTEEELEYKIHFYCYVSTNRYCKPSVKLLHQDKVSIGHRDLEVSETFYYADVSFEDSQRVNSSVLNSLTCEVTTCYSNIHQFLFRPQASDKDVKPAPTESSSSAPTVRTSSPTSSAEASPTELSWWWWLIVGAVTSAALVIVVIAVKRRQRGNGGKPQMNEKADPEDGLSYASVSFTKTSSSKAQVQVSDGGDAVTYSCVNTGASTGPSSLYATVSTAHR